MEEHGLAPGTPLGRYQVVRLVGRGGMASVYEGVHAAIGKRVAIKIIDPQVAALPGARARFLREAQLTSRLRHPHIVDIADIGASDGCLFLVMEYLEGEDLATRIARSGPLAVLEAIDIALPVLAAVAAAHDDGIIHCDLKSSNIFLARLRDRTVHPKVLDFGIARAMVDPEPLAGSDGEQRIVGSPGYFAPEQVRDPSAASPATDQYALGLMLYECMTGRLPYDGATFGDIFAQIVTAQYLPAVHYRPDLPAELQQVIARAMSLDPAQRFASVVEMGHALLTLASPAARMAWRKTFRAPAARRSKHGPTPVPVTVQTPGPGPVSAPRTATVAIAPIDPLPPPLAPRPTPEPERVAVPRSAAPRVFAALVLVAGVALTFVALRGAGAAPRLKATVMMPRVAAPAPARAVPALAPAPALPDPPVAEPDPPAPAPAAKVSGRARPRSQSSRSAAALRFGPNGAPLIE